MAIKERAETEIILSGGDKAGKTINELTAQSVKLYREIKKMEEGSDEFVKATADYQKVNSRLKEVRTQVNGVTKAQSLLNSELGQLIPFNSQLQKFMGTYKGMSSAIKGTTMAQKLLNAAFIASGIGALVVLFGSLISYLTTTQEGMDKLRQVTMPVIQVFERLKGLLQTFGKGLAQIVSGDVVGGFNSLKDAVTGIGDAFTEGIAAGKELADLTKEIEIATGELEISRARLNRQIAEAQETGDNEKAIALINQRRDLELNLIDLQIRKMELEHEANDTSRADELELQKLIANRENIEAAASRERKKLVAKLKSDQGLTTKVVEDESKKRIKAEEDYAKKVAKAEQDLKSLRVSLIEDTTERTVAEINLRFNREIAAFEGSENQKTEFLLLKQQERDQALADLRKNNTIKSFEEEEEERRMQLEESFYNFLITEKEREDMAYDLKKSEAQRRLDLIREMNGEESTEYRNQALVIAKIEKELTDKRLADARQFTEAKKNLELQGLSAFQDVVTSTIALLATEEDGRRKNVAAIKAFKAMQMKISFFSELQAIWETANANPSNILFPGAGNLIAGLKTAAAGARYVAGMREVMGAKYALGGPVFGPSHADGGIKFGVKGSSAINEMEGNEIILTKGVYQDPVLRDAASRINTLGGGRSFAMGGPINPLNNSVSPNDSPSTVVNNITNGSSSEENKAILNAINELTAVVSGWESQLEVRMSLQKLNKEMGRLKEVEFDAGI
jgi:hypothetical protein